MNKGIYQIGYWHWQVFVVQCRLSAKFHIGSLQKFAQVARDLAAAKEKISEKEEEVQELKSERNNTRVRERAGREGESREGRF